MDTGFGLGRGCFGREGVQSCTGSFPGSYRLYLVIDVWSRKIVAWDVAEREDSQITPNLVSRLEELGVLRSFSRPRLSNANPFSESLFRAM